MAFLSEANAFKEQVAFESIPVLKSLQAILNEMEWDWMDGRMIGWMVDRTDGWWCLYSSR